MSGIYTGVLLTEVEQGVRTVEGLVELKQRVENTGNNEKQPEYYRSICDALTIIQEEKKNER